MLLLHKTLFVGDKPIVFEHTVAPFAFEIVGATVSGNVVVEIPVAVVGGGVHVLRFLVAAVQSYLFFNLTLLLKTFLFFLVPRTCDRTPGL